MRDLLRYKGYDIWSVSPQTSTREALLLMAEKNIGALLVLEEEKIDGIISERDFVRLIAMTGECDFEKPVEEIMTKEVYCIDVDRTIDEVMHLMSRQHFRHLPVMENKKLVGVISISDVVNEIISDQEIKINDLENYIEGRGYIR